VTGKFRGKDGAALRVLLEQISDRCFLLEQSFEYVDGAQIIVVPAGLLTDLTSIPDALRFFEGPHGRHTLAALLHDYQVNNKADFDERTQADDLFRRTLTELGVRRWRANVMWAAVHLMSRLVSTSWVARVATVLWLLNAMAGYSLLVTWWVHREPALVALALAGPFLGAVFWLVPFSSVERYKCGAVAGLALSILGPFAVVNLAVMSVAWILDLYRRGSRAPFQWEQATNCPGPVCKCGRGSVSPN
jgi:hypothetical protein